MPKIPDSCRPVNARQQFDEYVIKAQETLNQTISKQLNEMLVRIVNYVVGRKHYARRERVPQHLKREGTCCRCGTTRSQEFSRNGYRPRKPLVTPWGEIALEVPRVRCDCGGSVRIDFGGLLRPYQRIVDEVDREIQRLGKLGLSLRQMSERMNQLHIGTLALRTLNQRLHQLQNLDPQRANMDVPPILQVDAIWVTLLRPNGKYRRDKKGRLRAVKGRHKVPIMIAMGVWPDNDRCEILFWRLGENEGADEWVAFLEELEEQGIRGDQGLRLIIHDGGTGLCSALQTVWFDAATQRCLFHKIRNIAQAIQLPEGLTHKQRRRQRRKILKDFKHIWAARQYQTMLRRYLKVARTYRNSQPKAVATLRRDFRATVTYYALEREFPDWQRHHLRTTSRLERFNRTLRRRMRAANAYHSDVGLKAMLAQEVLHFHLSDSVFLFPPN